MVLNIFVEVKSVIIFEFVELVDIKTSLNQVVLHFQI